MIYFDNSATTKPSQRVFEVISEELRSDDSFGNPGSLHKLGLKADKEYKEALKTAASILGCRDEELFFTSCGTEGANTAIEGYMSRNKRAGQKIISTNTEHKATLETLALLSGKGYEVVYLKVDRNGSPDLSQLEQELDENTALLCFTYVNNETGAILPLEDIVKIRERKNRNTAIYLDCVQSLGKLPTDLKTMGVQMASFSGHKIHSVKGVGMLYIKSGTDIDPLILGGGQQKGLRSGTQSLLLAKAFTAALKEAEEKREEAFSEVSKINSYLREELSERGAVINSPEKGLPFVLNVAFDGFESETMLHCLELYDIFVSTVSACSSKSKKVSYVLLEMGIDRKIAVNSVRLSFSRYNTMDEAVKFVEAVDDIYSKFSLKR
ncbi:MAG: cysteine desulfurase [Clostridiales bacterium]|nr:cysteine desulfurase [Clostridiales bacterium]